MKNGLIVVKTNTLKGKDIFNEKWSYCRQDQYICKERIYLMRNSLIDTNTFERKGHI